MPTIRQLVHIGRVLSQEERRIFRASVFLFLAAAVWFVWSLLGAYRTLVPAVGRLYAEAVVGSPQLINPVFASVNDVDVDLARLIFSGLVRYDEENRLVPDLAARYEVSDDKKTYTFHLKKDAVWHDGERFTAKDVHFTMETIQNPAVASPLLVTFQGIAVKAIDDYTIQFQLKEPFAPFLSSLTVGMLPEHLWGAVPPEHMRGHKLNASPIGTGPFMVKKFVKEGSGAVSEYSLKRFDRFYRQPPYLSEFVFRFYSEYEGDGGAVAALRQQEVSGLSFVPFQMRDKIQRKHMVLHTLHLPQYSALFFNMGGNGAVQSLDARMALTRAIDKDRIVRESLKNEGQVIDGPILPGFPGYSTTTQSVAYNPEEANAALDKLWARIPSDQYREERRKGLLAAWDAEHPSSASTTPDAGETSATTTERDAAVEAQLHAELREAQTFYRKTKDGDIVSLSLVTADTPEYRQTAQLVSGFWQDIGIQTRVTFVAPKDFNRSVLHDRSYDVLLYGVIIGSDPDQYPFWHSSQTDFPGLNLSRYANRTVDGVLEKARAAADEQDQAREYGLFQDALLKDRPAVFLYSPTYTYATTDQLKGLTIGNIFHPSDRFAGVTNWYMKTKRVWRF